MTYFDQMDPINDIFDQSHVQKYDILTYDVILAPKMAQFRQFSPKMA